MNKKDERLQETIYYFENMCDKARWILIDSCLNDDIYADYILRINEMRCDLTPIEQILYVAYYSFMNRQFKGNIPIEFYELESQVEIKKDDKKYIADFVLDFTKTINLPHKYLIELDGFNYHSNKIQINKDYERENDLKSLGYNVIRFTGSQVYKAPFECIRKIIDIIKADILKGVEKNANN